MPRTLKTGPKRFRHTRKDSPEGQVSQYDKTNGIWFRRDPLGRVPSLRWEIEEHYLAEAEGDALTEAEYEAVMRDLDEMRFADDEFSWYYEEAHELEPVILDDEFYWVDVPGPFITARAA